MHKILKKKGEKCMNKQGKNIKKGEPKKTAGNNQWTGASERPVHSERRDGPGGEDSK